MNSECSRSQRLDRTPEDLLTRNAQSGFKLNKKAVKEELPPLPLTQTETYGTNTKSTEKQMSSALHTKGSLNMSGIYPDSADPSVSINQSFLRNLNSSLVFLGSEGTESIEDIHTCFVAFYQRSKRVLGKLEMAIEIQRDKGENDSKGPEDRKSMTCKVGLLPPAINNKENTAPISMPPQLPSDPNLLIINDDPNLQYIE